MKNLLIACVVIGAFASNSFAKLMFVPLEEAVKNSDLIVIGTLKGISEKDEAGTIYGKGEIFVEEFIAGNVRTAENLPLKTGDKLQLNYIENFACVMGSHKRIENEKGIFLLTLDDNGEIQSEDFRSLENLAEIKNLLKKGVKPNKIFKTIKTRNESGQDFKVKANENLVESDSEISFCAYSNQPKPMQYYPLQALLIILTSILLHYLLYRSRFKIR